MCTLAHCTGTAYDEESRGIWFANCIAFLGKRGIALGFPVMSCHISAMCGRLRGLNYKFAEQHAVLLSLKWRILSQDCQALNSLPLYPLAGLSHI